MPGVPVMISAPTSASPASSARVSASSSPASTSGDERVRLAVRDRHVSRCDRGLRSDDVAHGMLRSEGRSARSAAQYLRRVLAQSPAQKQRHGASPGVVGAVQAEVREAGRGRDPAAGCAFEQAALQQERLVDVFDRLRRLTHRDRERAEADGPAAQTCGTARGGSRGRLCRGPARRLRTARARRARRRVVTMPSARTSAKSRTRFNSRLAMRGVPARSRRDLVGAFGVELDAENRARRGSGSRSARRARSSRGGRRSRSGRATGR